MWLTTFSVLLDVVVLSLEAQLPIYWVLVLGSLYRLILYIAQEPTTWVPGLLGYEVLSPQACRAVEPEPRKVT